MGPMPSRSRCVGDDLLHHAVIARTRRKLQPITGFLDESSIESEPRNLAKLVAPVESLVVDMEGELPDGAIENLGDVRKIMDPAFTAGDLQGGAETTRLLEWRADGRDLIVEAPDFAARPVVA